MNDGFNFKNLDRRMGRHHGISLGSNKVDLSLQEFCNMLMSDIEYDSDVEDLEIYLTEKYYDSN